MRSCNRRLPRNELCLYKHGDDGASGQTEGLVTENAEKRAAFTRVRGNRDDGSGIGGEELVEDDLGAVVLRTVGFGGYAVPDFVVPKEQGQNWPHG